MYGCNLSPGAQSAHYKSLVYDSVQLIITTDAIGDGAFANLLFLPLNFGADAADRQSRFSSFSEVFPCSRRLSPGLLGRSPTPFSAQWLFSEIDQTRGRQDNPGRQDVRLGQETRAGDRRAAGAETPRHCQRESAPVGALCKVPARGGRNGRFLKCS
jgi:hypothetical protein